MTISSTGQFLIYSIFLLRDSEIDLHFTYKNANFLLLYEKYWEDTYNFPVTKPFLWITLTTLLIQLSNYEYPDHHLINLKWNSSV